MLNAVLGDGMSSRLFLSVREERGLAYDVSSGLVDYADAGALEVSAGVDPDKLPEAIEAILAELARLRDEPVRRGGAVEGEALPRRRPRAAHGRDPPRRLVDRWAGGAPRSGPHGRGGARRHRRGRRGDIRELAERLFVDDALRLAAVARPRHLRGLDRHLRLPA